MASWWEVVRDLLIALALVDILAVSAGVLAQHIATALCIRMGN